MLLNNDDAQVFPKFKRYLQNDFSQLVSNSMIVDKITELGNYGDSEEVKRFIKFGAGPRLLIGGTKGRGFEQFNEFTILLKVNNNMVKAFEKKEDMEGNSKFLNQLVFFTTGRGHRILQLGLKLLELLIHGKLLISKNTSVIPDDNAKALRVIKERVATFENDVYGGVNTSGALFF